MALTHSARPASKLERNLQPLQQRGLQKAIPGMIKRVLGGAAWVWVVMWESYAVQALHMGVVTDAQYGGSSLAWGLM